MTITWSKTEFNGPHSLSQCGMPTSSGLYAIMIQTVSNTYKIVYFGESSNFNERVNLSHHKYDCWINQSGSENKIYFGLHVMPNSTPDQRRELESFLIQKFNPNCND